MSTQIDGNSFERDLNENPLVKTVERYFSFESLKGVKKKNCEKKCYSYIPNYLMQCRAGNQSRLLMCDHDLDRIINFISFENVNENYFFRIQTQLILFF